MQTSPELAIPVPQIDGHLAAIIRETETGANAFGLRFERKAFNNVTNAGTITPVLARIMQINHCSQDTARMIYSTSWGAYQEMGENIYNSKFGYTGPIITFANDLDAQTDLYALFLQADSINWAWDDIKGNPVKWDTFALKYNGSTNYVDNMRVAAKTLGYL